MNKIYLDKKASKTGVQEMGYFHPSIDFDQDFVMVYGFNDLKNRVQSFKDAGYHIQFMTGIAWGEYQDYILGKWDNKNHYDEAQMDRFGQYILHGKDMPYMVPNENYINYLIEKLKLVIDLGIYEIHLEEPEFWYHAGYSKAFKQAFFAHYKKQWTDPEADLNAMYEQARLKSLLYVDALSKIAFEIKKYALKKYNLIVQVYVPTHSLLNYTQWKIISPEGKLAQIAHIDGFIAQVWTGTAREANVYQGIQSERTFDTAFLEYGLMQSLVTKSHQKIWFLNDPIEDNPQYSWKDYQFNYEQTLVAALLHPEVNNYEIAPWPLRIFNRKLPILSKPSTIEPSYIPKKYDVYLNNVFQMLHQMPKSRANYDGHTYNIGLFLADNAMFQRNYPKQFKSEVFEYISSLKFPDYYGLSLPLLKSGIPLQGAVLDRAHDLDYLKSFSVLILSYDFMKPESKQVHDQLKKYIENGGLLIFVGDHKDPYNDLDSWWQQKGFKNPSTHLFETLGINDKKEHHQIGKGGISILNIRPQAITINQKNTQKYLNFFRTALTNHKIDIPNQSYILLQRGNYIIGAGINESNIKEVYTMHGLFANMLDNQFEIVESVTFHPNTYHVLYDLSKAKFSEVIGSTYRFNRLKQLNNQLLYLFSGKTGIEGSVLIKVINKPITVMTENKQLKFTYDKASQTIFIQLMLNKKTQEVVVTFE